MKTGEVIKSQMFEKRRKRNDQDRKSGENLMLTLIAVSYGSYIINIHITIKKKTQK